jgi:hypothetical protein
MEAFVVDTPKLELLENFLVALKESFGAAVPTDLKEVVSGVTSAVHLLKNRLECKLPMQVAQLARNGNLDGALKTMLEHFPDLKIGKVVDILKLIYVSSNRDLVRAIGFVEKLRIEFRQEAYAYEVLYENVWLKGHTEMPGILLLQSYMIKATGESEMMKQVDENCNKIVDRIVEGVRVKDYKLSKIIIKSCGSSILEGKMASIVEKVHSAGTLEDTLLLLKFSEDALTKKTCKVSLFQALFLVLQSKNLLVTDQSMHLWASVSDILNFGTFLVGQPSDKEKCLSIWNELGNNLPTYFEIYRGYVESPDLNQVRAVHKDNVHLHSILPQFVDFYFKNDKLNKAQFLLSAAKNVDRYYSSFLILNSLYEKMVRFDLLNTFEAYTIFILVKSFMSDGIIDKKSKLSFGELQEKAPPCVQLMLWPKPAGAKFRLVNKCLDTPLYCVNMKVCGIPPAACRNTQLWSAQVDPLTGRTTFKIQGNEEGGRFLNGKTGAMPAGLCNRGTQWKVKAIDQYHVKLYSDGK